MQTNGIDHYWFECEMHIVERRKRDLTVHATHGHTPPFMPLTDPAQFLHCPLPTRKTLKIENAAKIANG